MVVGLYNAENETGQKVGWLNGSGGGGGGDNDKGRCAGGIHRARRQHRPREIMNENGRAASTTTCYHLQPPPPYGSPLVSPFRMHRDRPNSSLSLSLFLSFAFSLASLAR